MRDGRRQRLGLGGSITATYNPGEDPGDISTSGIGSLISISDLYNEALAGENATTGNQAYLDRILDEAGPNTLSLDPGAYVDTRDNRYINDAYNYYLGGGTGDFADEVALTGDDTITNVDTGDGGEDLATSGLDLGAGTGNTDFEQNLLDQGIGVQGAIGDPVVAPGEMLSTQAEMDAFNQISVTPQTYADTGRADLLEQAGGEDYGDGGFQEEGSFDDQFQDIESIGLPEKNIVDDVALTGQPTTVDDLGEITADDYGTNTFADNTATLEDAGGTYDGNQSAEGGFGLESEFAPYGRNPNTGEAYQTPRSISDQNAVLGQTFGTVNEVTEDPTMQETISNAFTSARQGIGDLATAGVDKIQEVGQSIANTIGGVYNGVDQTVSVFGKDINVPATLAGIALSQVVGAPINIAFGVAKAVGGTLPQDSLENSITRSIAAELTAEKDYGYNMQSGNIGQDPFGRNPVSAFGNYEQTLMDDINNPSNTNLGQKKTEYANDYFDKKAEQAGGVVSEPGTVVGPGETPVTQKEIDAFNEPTQEEKDAAQEAATTASNAASVDLGAARYGDGGPGYDGPSSTTAANEDFSDFDEGDTSTADPSGTGDFGDATTGNDTSPGATGGEGGSGDGCFLAGTLVTMADGSTKPVEQVDLKNNVAEGGKVFATGKFLVKNLHDYKSIKVSGSHMVNEDGNWIRVEDSKHGKPLGDDEHTVYVFGSENRRILINGILFTDYFETKEQDKLLDNEEDFFKNWKSHGKTVSDENVDALNAV